MWKASTGLQEDTYLLYPKDYTCTLFQKYFSINQCNNFYRIIKEEEKWIGAGITSIIWSSLVHFFFIPFNIAYAFIAENPRREVAWF